MGRPLSFDRQAALDQAMRLFWRHGYEGTSINHLTTALGITPPSIYTAFGDKKGLFLEAVNLYLTGPAAAGETAGSDATAREFVEGFLRNSAIRFTGSDTPAGCLVASAAISCSASAADVRGELTAIRLDTEGKLRDRLARATEVGELPADTDVDALAALVMTVVQGLSTLARDGATREKLMRVIDVAMKAWPQ